MRKIHLFLAIILFGVLSTQAAGLTVVVAVDNADALALEQLRLKWQEGNLKVWSTKASIEHIHYSQMMHSSNAALATLLTGVMPAEHGICADSAFNRETRVPENIFLSKRPLAIGTPNSYDCDALLVPTMTDRLRMQSGATARIYAIGLQPSTTMILAGKAANACCWIEPEEKSGEYHWVSTSYYQQGLPSAADRMNISGELNRLMRRYKDADTAVVELSLLMQMEQQLGVHNSDDALLIQLSDTHTLTGLMETLIRRIGKDALHLIVIGLPTTSSSAQLEEWNMGARSFNLERTVALTSSYLMALYGNERWLDGGYGNSIYLNKMLITYKKLSLETIRQQVAEFLMEFDGIRFACPISDAYLREDMQEYLHKRFVGDVVFELQGNYMPKMTSPAIMLVNTHYSGKWEVENEKK